jgi:hypothetical protein
VGFRVTVIRETFGFDKENRIRRLNDPKARDSARAGERQDAQ